MTVSNSDKEKFEEIRKRLTALGGSESNFTGVELMFYEALTISRKYGEDPSNNPLLARLKHLEANEYRETKDFFKKSSQREKVIRKFIVRLKAVLQMKANLAVSG